MLEALEIPREWLPRVLESAEVSGTTPRRRAGRRRARATRRRARSGSARSRRARPPSCSAPRGVVFSALDAYRGRPAGARARVLPRGARALARDGRDALRGRLAAVVPRHARARRRSSARCSRRRRAGSPGRRGCTFLPYLAGERTPHADPDARGAFTGLSLRHDRGALARAVLEGVAFGLRDCLDLVRERRRRAGDRPRVGRRRPQRAVAADRRLGARAARGAPGRRGGRRLRRRAARRRSRAACGPAPRRPCPRAYARAGGWTRSPRGSRPTAEQRERFRALYPALRDIPLKQLHFPKLWRRTAEPAVRRPLRRHHPGDRQHAAGRAQAPLAEAGRAHLGQARVPQPDGLGQGPRRARADRGRRGEGRDRARPDDPRADLGQHRHLAGDDLLAQGLSAQGRHARQRDARAHPAAADVRRRDRLLARRPGLQRRRRDGAGDGRGRRLVLHALPVRQPGEPARALQRHGARDPRGARRDQPRSSPASAPAAR